MKYSKGIMWLDDCRIPFVDEGDIPIGGYGSASIGYGDEYEYSGGAGKSKQQGRFTPNLLVSDDMLNDGIIYKSGKNKIRKSDGFNKNAYGIGIGIKEGENNGEYGDKGTNSRYYDLDKWFDKVIDGL
jgi:hypothetical protein